MDEDLWAAFDNDLGEFDPEYDYLDAPKTAQDVPPPLLPTPTPTSQSSSSSFYSQCTESLRSSIANQPNGPSLAARVANSLKAIAAEGLNLEIFLDAVFWGDTHCTSDPIVRYKRSVFMGSPTLSRVLGHWSSHTSQGQPVLQEFVIDHAAHLLEKELTSAVPRFRPGPDPLSKDSLTAVNFREFGMKLRSQETPYLWALLQRLACSPRQERENSMKNPFHIILTIISMLSYSRSHNSSVLAMNWSIYLKACGLSARAFDALHMLGLTMSHKWTANTFGHISQAAGVSRNRAIANRPHFGSHDNLNFPKRVFSQRLHNMNHFINASAATIWILPKEALLPADINPKAKEQRRKASQAPFSLTAVFEEGDADARVNTQSRYRILRFLLDSPAFEGYRYRDHAALAAPPPSDLLPCGPTQITEQHILETVEVDESSYDGTDELCNKIWLEQMGYNLATDKQKLGEETLLVWVGDQLTVDRIRGLARYRHDDPNSFTRMEWIEPVFGWFHALMAYANSLHTQYLGTSAGVGLRKAFETLGRKGLMMINSEPGRL